MKTDDNLLSAKITRGNENYYTALVTQSKAGSLLLPTISTAMVRVQPEVELFESFVIFLLIRSISTSTSCNANKFVSTIFFLKQILK